MRRLALLALLLGAGCSYLKQVGNEALRKLHQAGEPSQHGNKHLLTADTWLVLGRVVRSPVHDRARMAILAVSDELQEGEVVDANHLVQGGSFFVLNLPAGVFRVLAVRDANGDGVYDEREVVARRDLTVGPGLGATDGVLSGLELDEAAPAREQERRLHVEARPPPAAFPDAAPWPPGSVRALDDALFSDEMSELGVFQPAEFLERAPNLFYALEAGRPHRIPVVFVHGMEGSAREFSGIVERLDLHAYQPWFFQYPSGKPLAQLGEAFYQVFLSGRCLASPDQPLVIVAHSMGGLVVRDALDRLTGAAGENRVGRLVTIASPLAGDRRAEQSARAPLFVPAWRDLQPDSAFVRSLYRRSLPPGVGYHLFFTFGSEGPVQVGGSGDGSVSVAAQLPPEAQREATAQLGFDATHAGVLTDQAAIREVVRVIGEVHPAAGPPDSRASGSRD